MEKGKVLVPSSHEKDGTPVLSPLKRAGTVWLVADPSWLSFTSFNFKLQQMFEFSIPISKEKDEVNLDVAKHGLFYGPVLHFSSIPMRFKEATAAQDSG